MELADTSAWTARHRDPAVLADFDERVLAGEVAICGMVAMELLWTAQGREDFHALRGDLGALPGVDVTPAAWDRAVEVWARLVDQGRHRQVKPADLLVAATAKLAEIGVCHYDRSFELIASVTGQPQRAIAPIGSL